MQTQEVPDPKILMQYQTFNSCTLIVIDKLIFVFIEVSPKLFIS